MSADTSSVSAGGARIRLSPFQLAVMLVVVAAAVNLTAAFVLEAFTDWDSLYRRLAGVLVLAAMAVAVAVSTRFGFAWTVRSGRLLILPAVLAVLPFFAGVQPVQGSILSAILIGEAATGIFEELWFRGLTLSALGSWTPFKATMTVSALFGLSHLANIAYGADAAITAAQVIGAFTFGVGYAALRLRTIALWPLMILHALTDISLAIGNVTGGLRWGIMIGSDTILLIYGIILLRQLPRGTSVSEAIGGQRTAPSRS
ncbi:membrane protease YdiL (CAAX protease family) [Pseudarthrobacter defluvii]|uniref:Membrane protease YdiL (CAAX protease family) n=1 Tax=Pseudarthrobacter defluvii TaxID=410837 RepID=A0ABT9UFN0_9MICC|nr:CPBP family intramembrane glutamic endopeptidase [Pseudarthrobacter defluvii]MDQ0118453.1 membrane protease YdiL (CAAX protease family) [Pseudarthrobacter defluvii]